MGIDQHRAGFHGRDHGARHEFGRGGSGEKHRPDDEVRIAHQPLDGRGGRILRGSAEPTRTTVTQAIDRAVGPP